MSGDYVSRDYLLGEYDRQHQGPPGGARKIIAEAPAADVVEVRHGRWCVTDAYPHNVYCSQCYKIFAQEHWEIWQDGSLPRDYCPSCGVVMDGGKDK